MTNVPSQAVSSEALWLLSAHVAAIGDAIRKLQDDFSVVQNALEEISAGGLRMRNPHGRLTRAGKMRLEQLCSQGSRVSDIATALGISPAAASVNCKKYRARAALGTR